MSWLTLLISPDGEWLSPDTPEFYAVLGDPNPDYDSIGFAVRNLGFIKFRMIERTIIEIELHPRNATLPALLAAQQQLQSSPMRLFRIKYLDSEWRSEISSSAEHTIERLSELCAPQFAPVGTNRFTIEPKSLSTLFDDEGNPLRPLAQKWRISFGYFDPSIMSLAVRHGLLSRMMIVGVTPGRRDPTWRFIGESHNRWMGRDFQLFGMGEKVENTPDKHYGEWAAEFYKSVASSGQPRCDWVMGSVRYQTDPGQPMKPARYERALLPWKTASDEVLITVCSRPLGAADGLSSDLATEPPAAKKVAISS